MNEFAPRFTALLEVLDSLRTLLSREVDFPRNTPNESYNFNIH